MFTRFRIPVPPGRALVRALAGVSAVVLAAVAAVVIAYVLAGAHPGAAPDASPATDVAARLDAVPASPAASVKPAATRTPGTDIVPALSLDQPLVATGAAATVHLLVRFDVPETDLADSAARPPIHLALVIDRSGSMGDAGKLAYAKVAAKSLVGLLRPTDRLAIVEYDDRITVLWPSSPVTAPDLVQTAIDRLSPRGRTNLGGGLAAGLAEILRDRQSDFTCRTILLSDGLANTGVTAPREIASLAVHGRQRGVAVTTMGLGRDYNEDLMQGVALGGGGRYYYIESPAGMQRVYEAELGKVMQQATRDLALWFDAGTGVEATAVYGYPFESQAARTTITMDDLYGGDSRVVLLRLRVEGLGAGDHEIGRLGWRYTDVADGKRHEATRAVTVRATADTALVARSVEAAAATEATLITADERHNRAVRVFEAGDKARALASLDSLRSEIEIAHRRLGDPKLAKKLEALALERTDMDQAERDASYRAGYLKRSKAAFYGSTRGKREKYLLEPNASGLEVEDLQRKLAASGLYAGPVDGRYDDEVRDAVSAFQRAQGLSADGIAGPATLRALGLF